MTTVHATCVDLDGKGVLLRGPSGSGKSDLALRLIDSGARLVADDYVRVSAQGGRLIARAPETIAGIIEVRGVGLLKIPCLPESSLVLIADLVEPDVIERLPETETTTLAGLEEIPVQHIQIAPFEASASAKIRAALNAESVTDRG